MSVTYSINIGTQFEASRKSDILSVLQGIPDNTHKLISPRDVRDAFLSTWANSPFKQTKNLAGIEYIGIDSGNPSDRDIKQKIFLGKRSFGNLDIMSSSLLNSSSADIFIYNTKSDSITQSSTKVAFLSGTNSSLYQYAPFIESKVVNDVMNLELRNPSLTNGPINIYSSSGRVSINGIIFPSVAETTASASNGKILKYSGSYPNGSLRWENPTVTLSEIGTPGITTNIYGSTVSLNGYSLEFIDDAIVPATIGGVLSGASFTENSFNGQNWPLSEVIREILYPYLEPTLSLSVYNSVSGDKYVEIGTTPTLNFVYDLTIYPRTESEYISNYVLAKATDIFSYGLSFSGNPGSTFSGTSSTQATLSASPATIDYTFSVSNIPGTSTASYIPAFYTGWSYSATASIEYVYPIYYGFTSSVITTTASFGSLGKIIKPKPTSGNSISPTYGGSGYLYFIYSNSLSSDPVQIKDPNGFIIFDIDSYTYSTFGTTSTPYTNVGGYKVWKTTLPCSYSGSNNFEFKF